MRSKANIKSHPLHPILVSFPIAFFIGTLLFDVLGAVRTEESFYTSACYLEAGGIMFALLAAVPGIIDYKYTVPPESSAKKRATKHALTNITMLVVFAIALYYRQTTNASIYIIIAIEVVGVVLLSIAGWMGGTLVHRNQIGVDIRYADAGKWNEKYVEETSGKIEVGVINELKVNQMKLIHLNGKRIVIGKTENGYVGFEDRCRHKGGSLAGGAMMCGTVQCPWHGSQFDVQTGELKAGPAKERIKTYNVTTEANKIFLNL